MRLFFKKILFVIVSFYLFMKIILYYLLKNKTMELRNTVIEFIIMLTKINRKEFYSQKNNNKKIEYNNQTNSTDLAILIPTQLRCWKESKDMILSLAEKYHIFIFTDPEYKKEINHINNSNIHIFYSDNKKYENKKKHIIHNQLHQWFKLHCLIEEVYDYEKANNIFFKTFCKIRTDFSYLNQNELVNIEREMNENCLFARSDLSFSGRREYFLPLGNFFESASQVYINFNKKLLPICTSQIINSDYNAYRFHWLKYPKEIIKKIDHKFILKAFDIKNTVSNKENKFLQANKLFEENESSNTYDAENEIFSTEEIFARYLNMNNIACKSHVKFAGALMSNRF